MKVVVSLKEQKRVLKACHSEPTSGHFGVTKTYKRTAASPYFPKKKFGGSVFIKKIVRAHDLEGSKFFRGGPKFAVKKVPGGPFLP